MNQMILILAGLILIAIGVILVYDTRIITNRVCNISNQNKRCFECRIIGYTLSIIGILLIYFFIQ